MSTRSKRREYSASAASPRARTSSMMAATAASTSAAASRLAPSSAAKRCSKSADRDVEFNRHKTSLTRLRQTAGRVRQRVAGTALGRRAKLHVAKLDLDAFDVEAHQRAVGEGEHDHAGRRIGLLERHRPAGSASSPCPRLQGRDAKPSARGRTAARWKPARPAPSSRPPSHSACRRRRNGAASAARPCRRA